MQATPHRMNSREGKKALLYDGHNRKAGRTAFWKDLRHRFWRRLSRSWLREIRDA